MEGQPLSEENADKASGEVVYFAFIITLLGINEIRQTPFFTLNLNP